MYYKSLLLCCWYTFFSLLGGTLNSPIEQAKSENKRMNLSLPMSIHNCERRFIKIQHINVNNSMVCDSHWYSLKIAHLFHIFIYIQSTSQIFCFDYSKNCLGEEAAFENGSLNVENNPTHDVTIQKKIFVSLLFESNLPLILFST